MLIREATDLDVTEILEVLKASLGETSSKKTFAVWNYKHLNNPFGKSLILVAIENGVIIGVRAFMRWNWQMGEQVFSAYRAVDTATHPNHQGKGVFKKLTLSAIEIAKEKGYEFIFNTPNSQSLPGYIKMGWEKVDKLKIRVVPVNPFNWLFKTREDLYAIENNNSDNQTTELISKYEIEKIKENKMFTSKSPKYLHWRYQNNPLQEYEVKADQDFYLAGYIKKHKYFKELRISEHIYSNNSGLQKIHASINELSEKFKVQVITSTELNYDFGFLGNFGPILTLRELNLDVNLKQELIQLNNWSYNLGDLELF